MKNLILIFIGGGLGSMVRYIVVKYINQMPSGFPMGTFLVNIIGSLAIGLILGFAARSNGLSESQIIFLATGFCGGFTTFSTFSHENHIFMKNGEFGMFAVYSIGSFALGFLAVFLGVFLAKMF